MFEQFELELQKNVLNIHALNKGIELKEIEVFEKRYGMRLPKILQEWLLLHNGGELFSIPVGTCIAGILGDNQREKGTFYLEDNFNEVKRVGVPDYIFILAITCEGNIIGFDLRRTNLNDGIVVCWDHESDELEEEWKGLEEWLNDEMDTGSMVINYDGTEKDI